MKRPLPPDPGRLPRGCVPQQHAKCKRTIKAHVDAVLVYTKALEPWPRSHAERVSSMVVAPKLRRQQAAEDVLALALETISQLWTNTTNAQPEAVRSIAHVRRQDMLLARYALKQAMRLSPPRHRLGVG